MAEIKIFDSHHPALESGTYKITISQNLSAAGNALTIDSPEINFNVAGEQYAIDQQQIDSVFPPAGGMGDFSLVLPHIVLNRSTLPWEREAQTGITTTPWLALLLFTEDEMALTEVNSENKQFFVKHILKKDWDASISASNKDLISIIVYKEQNDINKILPIYNELSYLAHVRSNGSGEKAVVVCNRLPKMDKKNILHLVSLENRFNASGEFINEVNGNMALVSLKSWEFFCNDHFIITDEVLTKYKDIQDGDEMGDNLHGSDVVDPTLKDALSEITGQEYFDEKELIKKLPANYQSEALSHELQVRLDYLLKTFRIGHLPDILKHLNRTPCTLRLPDAVPGNPKPAEPENKEYLLNGYINVPYTLKTGKEIEAFYRGPLIPGSPVNDSTLIILRHADEALRYFSNPDKLDVSYASAWQLGKLLAIQNKNFSTALYQWKRTCYQAIKQNNNLPLESYPQPSALVSDWFNNLKDMKGIPFNYLVPDPSYIPFESIRFFSVDETWIMHMIDGAFSIGRISDAEKNYDNYLYSKFNFLKTSLSVRSGFLLHSVAVAGWPDLVIYNGAENSTPYLKNKLSPNLLLALFDNSITSLGIHQKPESIHFGFEDVDNDDKLFNGSTRISYVPENSPGEAKKLNLPQTGEEVASFVNNLVQEIEVITFKAAN